MGRAKKIAFLKAGSMSHVNASVARVLEKTFPEAEIEVIDVGELVFSRKSSAFRILGRLHAYWEFGRLIFLRRHESREFVGKTRYGFEKIRRALTNFLASGEYAFTFQTESLFDGSQPGIPHFVYTSFAALANLDMPSFDKRDLWPTSWFGLETDIYRNATRVFTFSNYISRWIIQGYNCPAEKVICVGAGSNSSPEPGASVDAAKYSSKTILFVGIQWERKGGPALVNAFKRVLEVHPDAQLLIVGCSPEVYVRNCHAVGKVRLEDVNKYYEQAAVFCLPTTVEPFGLVFIEAFSHRLPVIAPPIGAVPDFLKDGENGFLVPAGDIEMLATSLIELIGDPAKCRTFGENGYALFQRKYNWPQVGSRIRDEIDRAIGFPDRRRDNSSETSQK
jgi:glycosyltransferase involved in cell wall biosynthesis